MYKKNVTLCKALACKRFRFLLHKQMTPSLFLHSYKFLQFVSQLMNVLVIVSASVYVSQYAICYSPGRREEFSNLRKKRRFINLVEGPGLAAQ